MRSLYFECFSGISGDMTVAALLDLGADRQVLLNALDSIKIDGFSVEIKNVSKQGISCSDFNVIVHEHEHQEHHHHRNLSDIINIINLSAISDNAKSLAINIFNVIGQAEAECHGVDICEIHFHEIGAIDSIVDIIAAAVCIDNLKIDKIYCPVIYEGTGHIKCSHGIMPVPAPATAQIAMQFGIPLMITDNNGEMVTPTGIGILAGLNACFYKPEAMKISKIGIGAGKKEFKKANILRVYLLDDGEKDDYYDSVVSLTSKIDDSTSEQLGFLFDILNENNALDVSFSPIFMKKNRPSYELNVLCEEKDKDNITKLIFKHSSTIGLRIQTINRIKMKRNIEVVSTKFGDIRVKICKFEEITKIYPEYEDLKQAAMHFCVAIDDISSEVKKSCKIFINDL